MRSGWHGWRSWHVRRSYLAVLAVLVEVTVLFWGAIASRQVFFQRDIHAYWLPSIETFRRVLAAGSWPVWDPYEGFGTPLLADPSSQALYPPTYLTLWIGPADYYKLYVVGHSLLAGAGAYHLFRAWRLSFAPALLGALSWAACGPLLSLASVHHHAAGAAWIPWTLWALQRALDGGGLPWALGTALVAGLQVLAGSADMCLVTALLASGQTAWYVLGEREARLVRFRRVLGVLAVALPAAAGLSAAQWLPTLAHFGGSGRAHMAPAANLYWSVHPVTVADLFVPGLFSELPMSPALRARLFEAREPFLSSFYLGAGGLALALIGALQYRAALRWFLLGALLVFVLAALGRYGGLLPVLLRLPPMAIFRYPVKYLVPVALCWAALVGAGLEAWRRNWPARDRSLARWVAGGLAAAALLTALLAWWSGRRGWWEPLLFPLPDATPDVVPYLVHQVLRKLYGTAALLALTGGLLWWRARREAAGVLAASLVGLVVLMDLVGTGRRTNTVGPPELITSRPPVLEALGPQAAGKRLFVPVASGEWLNRAVVRGPKGWDREWSFALGLQEMLTPPIGARWGLLGSYDANFTGLASPRLEAFSSYVHSVLGTPLALRFLQLASVDYVLAVTGALPPGLEEKAALPSVFSEPIRVLRVPGSLPPVRLADGVRVVSEPDLLQALTDEGLDVRREVVLLGGASPQRPRADFEGEVTMAGQRPDRLQLVVRTNAPAWLLVAQAYDAGWRATVDAQPVPVSPANGIFQGVPVPAGSHQVTLSYRPAGLLSGGLLSAGTLGAALVYAGGRTLRRRRLSPVRAAAAASPLEGSPC